MLKHLTASLLATTALVGQAAAATYYVSNAAANGYALGADTNACTSKAAPCLTIVGAVAKVAAGGLDSIYVNQTGTTYAEANGSGYLDLGSAGFLGADPTQTCATKVTVQTTATSRVLNLPTATTYPQTLSCLVLDSQSVSGKQAVVPHQHALLTLSQVDFKNSVTSLMGGLSGQSTLVFDRDTADGSNVLTTSSLFGWAGDTSSSTIKFIGGSYSATVTTAQMLYTGTFGPVSYVPDAAGNFTALNGGGLYQFRITSATMASLDLELNQVGTGSNAGSYLQGGTITGLFKVRGNFTDNGVIALQAYGLTAGSCDIAPNYAGTLGFDNIIAENTTNCAENGGTYLARAGSSGNVVSLATSTGQQFNRNALRVAGAVTLGHVVVAGTDGTAVDASNTAAATGTINLGDTTAHAYFDQAWTSQPATAAIRDPNYSIKTFYLSKTGAPNCTITDALYTDSAGQAGTLVATSAGVSSTILTGTAQPVQFSFAGAGATATLVSPATKYHHVLHDSCAVDGANYVVVSINGVTTGGTILTGSAIPATTADAAHAALSIDYTANWKMADAQWDDNVVQFDGTNATQELEGFQLSTSAGEFRRNREFATCDGCGFGYGALTKNNVGTVTAASNVLQTRQGPHYGAFYNKAGAGFVGEQNTVLMAGTSTGACFTAGPDSLGSVNPVPATNSTWKNNVCEVNAGATPYQIYAGSTIAAIDYNDNLNLNAFGLVNYVGAVSGFAWAGLGYDTHSLAVDPLLPGGLTSQSVSDVTPPVNSPILAAGTDLRSSAPTDINKNPFLAAPTLGAVSFLSAGSPLQARVAGATTVYAIVRDASGHVWNSQTGAFEPYQAANLALYAQPLVQQGSSGNWIGPMPNTLGIRPARGVYRVDYRSQAGASPAESDAMASGKDVVNWDGSAEIALPVDPRRIIPPSP